MASEIFPGPRMAVLGGALQPTLRRVEAALSEPVRPDGRGESFIAVAENTLGHIGDAAEQLTEETKLLHGALAPEIPEAEIHRAVGRYEVVLDGLLQRYAELRVARPPAAHRRGHELLVAVFRHSLTQIRDWLRDVVDTGADPVQVLERKGLPTSGDVSLELKLTLTTPEELYQFTDWIDEQEQQERVEDEKSSFWSGLAVFAVGMLLGGLFFGDDD